LERDWRNKAQHGGRLAALRSRRGSPAPGSAIAWPPWPDGAP